VILSPTNYAILDSMRWRTPFVEEVIDERQAPL